jgi:hypothetical protein
MNDFTIKNITGQKLPLTTFSPFMDHVKLVRNIANIELPKIPKMNFMPFVKENLNPGQLQQSSIKNTHAMPICDATCSAAIKTNKAKWATVGVAVGALVGLYLGVRFLRPHVAAVGLRAALSVYPFAILLPALGLGVLCGTLGEGFGLLSTYNPFAKGYKSGGFMGGEPR